jgi:hypothetical protein
LASVRSSRLGLRDGNRLFRRLLVVGGNERFRLENQFEILLELKFWFRFGGWRRSGLFGDTRLFWSCRRMTGFGRGRNILRLNDRRKLSGDIREGMGLFLDGLGFFNRKIELLGRVGPGRCGGRWLFCDRKFFGDDWLRGNFGRGRRSGRLCWRRLYRGLGRVGIFEHRGPLVGEVHLFLDTCGIRRSAGLDRAGRNGFCSDWFLKFRNRFCYDRLGLSPNLRHRNFRDSCRWRFLVSRSAGSQFRVGETGGALESAAEFAEALGTT